MDKKQKKDLYLRGALRTIVALGAVTGLSFLYPPFTVAYITAGYGAVMLSMEHTVRKIKEKEEGAPLPKPINLRQYYLKGPEYVEEPKESILAKTEDKMVDTIMEKTPIVVEQVKSVMKNQMEKLRKSKFMLKINQSMLKKQNHLQQKNDENELTH